MTADLPHNVAMGCKAREILAYAESEGGDDTHFWKVIRNEALRLAPLPKSDETIIRPLSDFEGAKFARSPLTFGTYVDCSYEHVFLQDADYLDWLADRGMELNRWLKWRRARL